MNGSPAPPAQASPHASCEICSMIPDRLCSTSKGDERWGDPIPAAVGRLAIVGAPYYDCDTSGSNRALHKCPLCGSFYWWEFEYEYLAGGSEDTTVYTRLDQETGARLERECLAHVAAARERSDLEAKEHVAAIVASPDAETIGRAARFAWQARRWGFDVDLSGAIPVLVQHLFGLPADAGLAGLRSDLVRLIVPWIGESPQRAREVLRLIGLSSVMAPCAAAQALAAHCQGLLARRSTTPPQDTT
jgi:hypothetical protein